MSTSAPAVAVTLTEESVEALAKTIAALLERAPVKRGLWTRKEAAAAMGMSIDTFERKVQPWIRLVPCGALMLVLRAEIDRWIELKARHLIEP